MAKIGLFALNMSPKSGGVFSLFNGLVSHARHSKHRFVYLTAHPPAATTPLPENVEVVARPKWTRLATQIAMNAPRGDLLFRGRAASVAVLSAAAAGSPAFFSAVDAWLWPHCFKPVPNLRRTVVICHDMIHRHHPEYFSRRDLTSRRQAERLLPLAAAILCPSHASANDLIAAYPKLEPRVRLFTEAPCEVIPEQQCAAELKEVDERYGGVPLFLFVAVDWPHKNHQLLIDAALALREMTPRPFKVLFVGRRRGGAVAEAVRRKQAGDVVIEVGGVSSAMLAALYRRSTALVYPSLHEGFGIPLVEAMQYGLPMIASTSPCIPEVTSGAAALLPPTEPALWAMEMHRLLADPHRRAYLAELSRERAGDFNWAKTWAGVDDALDAALAGASASNPSAARPPGNNPHPPTVAPRMSALVGGGSAP